MKQSTGGGSFDPREKFVYFIASNVDRLKLTWTLNRYQLVGVNEIHNDDELQMLRAWCEGGGKLFIDSGIYNLTMTHARKFNTSMDQALALAPEEIDGFDKLFERYCHTIDVLGDVCWGYTELDQGGRENKLRMRAKLESLGYRPMPVYHPLNDGWDYYDYLATRYDRFAFGNLVQAHPSLRVRLMATNWERHLNHPDVWVHLLGVTASPLTLAFPSQSCDSSTWQSAVRWGSHDEVAMGRIVGKLKSGLVPVRGSESITVDNVRCMQLSANKARLLMDVHRDSQHAFCAALKQREKP